VAKRDEASERVSILRQNFNALLDQFAELEKLRTRVQEADTLAARADDRMRNNVLPFNRLH